MCTRKDHPESIMLNCIHISMGKCDKYLEDFYSKYWLLPFDA